MKNKYKYIIICLLVSLTSCNSWLDVDLVNKIDEEKLFGSKQGFYEALAGVYSEMSKSSLYGETLTMEYLDIYAGYYDSNNANYIYHLKYDFKNSAVANVHSSIWSNMYKCIASCNNILEWADKKSSLFSKAEKDQIKGEALALRAFLHFDLYRMFCPDVKLAPKDDGIPYNKEFGVSLPPIYSVEEVVQLVVNDLLEAEVLLTNDPITTVIPYELGYDEQNELINKDQADKYVARMNLYAVKAMKARVYQARGENVKAIAAAKEVIESEKFRLLDFNSVDKDDNMVDMLFSDEHIFSLRNKDLQDYSKDLHYDVINEGSTMSKKLSFSNLYSVYESNNDDARYVKWNSIDDFIKYTVENTDNFFRKMPIIKLSEMYLIISECSYSIDKNQSLEYVNTLRDHRIRNNSHWTSITKEYIMQEIRREYLCEGQLWYAYKRNNLAISGVTVDEGTNVFVFPMPQNEIEDGNRN